MVCGCCCGCNPRMDSDKRALLLLGLSEENFDDNKVIKKIRKDAVSNALFNLVKNLSSQLNDRMIYEGSCCRCHGCCRW